LKASDLMHFCNVYLSCLMISGKSAKGAAFLSYVNNVS
jgi:hypothetical protein